MLFAAGARHHLTRRARRLCGRLCRWLRWFNGGRRGRWLGPYSRLRRRCYNRLSFSFRWGFTLQGRVLLLERTLFLWHRRAGRLGSTHCSVRFEGPVWALFRSCLVFLQTGLAERASADCHFKVWRGVACRLGKKRNFGADGSTVNRARAIARQFQTNTRKHLSALATRLRYVDCPMGPLAPFYPRLGP